MKATRKALLNAPTVLLLMVLGAILGHTTQANLAGRTVAPAIVATVDLERIFVNLEARGAADAALHEARRRTRRGRSEAARRDRAAPAGSRALSARLEEVPGDLAGDRQAQLQAQGLSRLRRPQARFGEVQVAATALRRHQDGDRGRGEGQGLRSRGRRRLDREAAGGRVGAGDDAADLRPPLALLHLADRHHGGRGRPHERVTASPYEHRRMSHEAPVHSASSLASTSRGV